MMLGTESPLYSLTRLRASLGGGLSTGISKYRACRLTATGVKGYTTIDNGGTHYGKEI